MLKDLEQRAPEQGQVPTPTVSVQKSSVLKVVLITVVVLLSLNALGFYIWNLQERVAKSESKQQKTVRTENVDQTLAYQTKAVEQQKVTPQKIASQKLSSTDKETHHSAQQLSDENKVVTQQQKKKNVEQEPIKKVAEPEKMQISTIAPVVVESSAIEPLASEKVKVSKMTVSRRQLTSKELVVKKLASAEKSVNLNEIAKAEQLFEDVLIIDPNHKQARKQLAALWFGRKSYQQAVNLLSQGIAIDKQASDLRLMKARIHLKQGQSEAAYNALKPLASFEQEEYQVMLANVAQQTEQYPSAIGAYQLLIKMQPFSGRWHLGLAIVYDKNSQFSLAVNEYALALTKTNLSASSAKFAQQRMQALEE